MYLVLASAKTKSTQPSLKEKTLVTFFRFLRKKFSWYLHEKWSLLCDYLWVSWAYFKGQIFLQEKYWPSNVLRLLRKKPTRRVRILMRWWGMHDTVFEAHLADYLEWCNHRAASRHIFTVALCAQREPKIQMPVSTSSLPCIGLPANYGGVSILNGCPSSPIPDKLRQREWRKEKLQRRSKK